MPPYAIPSPCHSTAFTLWDDDFYAFSPRPNDSCSEEDLISLWAHTASEFSSAESIDSCALPSVTFTAPEFDGYMASEDALEPEPLTSRYIPEVPVSPPRSKRVRKPRILHSAADQEEKDLRAAIKASLATLVPAVPSAPANQASTSQLPPPPVIDAIEPNQTIEVHGREYTIVEFAQKYCRLHADPSGKTCK